MQTLCVIAHSPGVTAKLHNDLAQLFSAYLHIQSWCLDQSRTPPDGPCDMYLASFPSVFEAVRSVLGTARGAGEPARLVLAKRILSPVHFNRLLQLPAGTRALVAGNSKLACTVLQQAMLDFGIRHLELVLHYPGHLIEEQEGYRVAIVTGVNKWIPQWIETIVDVGAKDIAFTTYSSIIRAMGLPESLLDEVSKRYTIPIFAVTRKYYEENNKVNALLQCIEDAVFTVDLDGYIDICNKSAQEISTGRAPGRRLHIRSVFPELQLDFPLSARFSLRDSIVSVNGQHYILQIESIGERTGAVVLARQVRRVQELEGIVRAELKPRRSPSRHTFNDIFTCSEALLSTIELARRFASTRSTILLEGESGTGKELFAHAIHAASERADKPFVAINLAAMPENLAESELFGYVDGSFTGARKGGRRGLFEEAHQGTLFLDEIGDAPLQVQSKLLRALEEREIRRVGGNGAIPVDVRIIAATNRPLEVLTRDGGFRTDLFYRLCACPLYLPPLRERSQDILPLAAHIAEDAGRSLCLDAQVRAFFQSYSWPGNIRELHNVVNYLINFSQNGVVSTMDHLPRYLAEAARNVREKTSAPPRFDEGDFASVAAMLAAQRMLPLALEMLACLGSCAEAGAGIGRKTLLELLKRASFAISMYRLRQCLQLLEAAGLIAVGVSRQGCLPTERGLSFLRWSRTEGGRPRA